MVELKYLLCDFADGEEGHLTVHSLYFCLPHYILPQCIHCHMPLVRLRGRIQGIPTKIQSTRCQAFLYLATRPKRCGVVARGAGAPLQHGFGARDQKA